MKTLNQTCRDERVPAIQAVAIRNTVERFPETYRPRILALATRVPDRLDVIAASPAFALGLAHLDEFVGAPVADPLDKAVALIRQRQREALGVLGFPNTESCARILRRIPLDDLSIPYMLRLRVLLRCERTHRLLQHVSRITRGVISLFLNPMLAPALKSTLLKELAQITDTNTLMTALCDIEAAILLTREDAYPPPLRTLRECHRVARDRRADLETLIAYPGPKPSISVLCVQLPDPPIPIPRYNQDSLALEPINDGYALWREASEMKTCVFTYLEAIVDGSCYCYSLRRPERGTVMLIPHAPGHWVIAQARGQCNSQLQWSTILAVGAYLNKQQDRASSGCHGAQHPKKVVTEYNQAMPDERC